MSKDKIIFLGTSSAVPTRKRYHSAHYVEFKGFKFLLDAGENVQKRLLENGVPISRIDFVLISHFHGDHIFGLLPLLQSMDLEQRTKPLVIVLPKGGKSLIKRWGELFGFPNRYLITFIEKKTKTPLIVFDNEKIRISVVSGVHEVEQLSFSVESVSDKRISKDYLKKMGVTNHPLLKDLKKGKNVVIDGKKLIAKQALVKGIVKKFCYVTDTRIIPGIQKLCLNSDLLLVECTFSKDKQSNAVEHGHLTTSDVNAFVKKVNPKKLVLTHFSSRYKSLNVLRDEVDFKGVVLAKEDGSLIF